MEALQPAVEIKRLQRCINDLVSALALPAICCGGEPSQIVRTLLAMLAGMLDLDFVYVRLKDSFGAAPIESARVARSLEAWTAAEAIGAVLDDALGNDAQRWPRLGRISLGDADVSIVTLRLGLNGEIGVVVAASRRADFPGQTETLLLSVTVNQAAVGLQEARLLREQKRVADELDRRVAQRTTELAAATEELRKEVAERRLAEARLRQEERELKRSEALLAESQRLSSTGSFMWRVATDEFEWSDQSYRIFEIDRATPVTLEFIESRIQREDLQVFKQRVALARSGGCEIAVDLRLQMPNGSIKHIYVVARSSRDESGRLEYIGAIQDVTERRLSEEALGNARSELAHVARVTTLGVLTASIAHEVSQPLSGIITNASTCMRMLAVEPPDIDGARETARRTIRDGHRASEVITRLRALYGNRGAITEAVDLNDATREVLALSSSELQRDRVMLRLELADELPDVIGDRVQLQQVILNLVLNGAAAMSGVDDRPRQLVIRTGRAEDSSVQLTIGDVGVGLDPQTSDRLFEAFYTTKTEGMGIGLSVSRSIIESHHGKLWAARNDGPGATFSFSIPCQGVSAL